MASKVSIIILPQNEYICIHKQNIKFFCVNFSTSTYELQVATFFIGVSMMIVTKG